MWYNKGPNSLFAGIWCLTQRKRRFGIIRSAFSLFVIFDKNILTNRGFMWYNIGSMEWRLFWLDSCLRGETAERLLKCVMLLWNAQRNSGVSLDSARLTVLPTNGGGGRMSGVGLK